MRRSMRVGFNDGAHAERVGRRKSNQKPSMGARDRADEQLKKRSSERIANCSPLKGWRPRDRPYWLHRIAMTLTAAQHKSSVSRKDRACHFCRLNTLPQAIE